MLKTLVLLGLAAAVPLTEASSSQGSNLVNDGANQEASDVLTNIRRIPPRRRQVKDKESILSNQNANIKATKVPAFFERILSMIKPKNKPGVMRV